MGSVGQRVIFGTSPDKCRRLSCLVSGDIVTARLQPMRRHVVLFPMRPETELGPLALVSIERDCRCGRRAAARYWILSSTSLSRFSYRPDHSTLKEPPSNNTGPIHHTAQGPPHVCCSPNPVPRGPAVASQAVNYPNVAHQTPICHSNMINNHLSIINGVVDQ
ncbi:hypothetical protein DPEC_G00116210 [Dallia pectoralis]|uniref:Uncharacterized protein n=1 Tax=Dallia pectoralis TaxID=75939 RepID=A0ACC2GV14_DALPE|nr:hypothetical protein DPEC_G00116210 [Dallia pectoralis]